MAKGKGKGIRISLQLVEIVFSWTLKNVLNDSLFKDKVVFYLSRAFTLLSLLLINTMYVHSFYLVFLSCSYSKCGLFWQVKNIATTFSSKEKYNKSFIPLLIEETRTGLSSSLKDVSRAPIFEILKLESTEFFKRPNNLFYHFDWRRSTHEEKADDAQYKLQVGDLIAFFTNRPKSTDDLNRIDYYNIAYVLDASTLLSAKVIAKFPDKRIKKKQQLFAAKFTNINTENWTVDSLTQNQKTRIMGTVVQADSTVRITKSFSQL